MSWKGNSNTVGYVHHSPGFNIAEPVDESKIEIEDMYCAHFGCGKILTLPEKLCGCRCFDHMKKKEIVFFGNY